MTRLLKLTTLLGAVILLLAGCGKKGPPTLRSFEQPPPPLSLSAIHREKEILLEWRSPEGRASLVAGYRVLRSSGGEYRAIADLPPEAGYFADTTFALGRPYDYSVVSFNSHGRLSDRSNIVSVTPLSVPAPPGGLAFEIADDSVLLTWRAADEHMLYNVYKRTQEGSYGLSPLNAAPLNSGSFKDVLSVEKRVYYTIRGLRNTPARDEGPPSAEIMVDPSAIVPPAPADVRVFPVRNGVYLSWKEIDAPWMTGYRVFRRTGNGGYALLGETQTPTFFDTASPLSPRDYMIKAVGLGNEGPGTEVLHVVLPAE